MATNKPKDNARKGAVKKRISTEEPSHGQDHGPSAIRRTGKFMAVRKGAAKRSSRASGGRRGRLVRRGGFSKQLPR